MLCVLLVVDWLVLCGSTALLDALLLLVGTRWTTGLALYLSTEACIPYFTARGLMYFKVFGGPLLFWGSVRVPCLALPDFCGDKLYAVDGLTDAYDFTGGEACMSASGELGAIASAGKSV